jgi:protein arginine kinase activator
MLCQRCSKAQATVHLTDIVPPDAEKRERHLCEQCAAEEGVTVQKPETISTILDGFVKQAAGVQQVADMTCPECGITFREFRSQGILGCPQDYQVFGKALNSLIERAHNGATHHVGKTPSRLGGAPSVHTRIAILRREMREAVDMEDYERAAQLRDQITELETA